MLTIFDILLLFIALAVCSSGLAQRWSAWQQGRPENRPGSMTAILSYLISHKKILRKTGPGIAHLVIFWGFVFNVVILILAQFHSTLPLMVARTLALTADILGIAMLGAVLFLLVRRLKSPRRTSFAEAIIPFFLIILIILSGFLAAGVWMAIVYGDVPWWSPVGTALSFISPFSPVYMLIAIKIHFFFILLFIAILPFTLLRHVITTPLNIYYKHHHPLSPLPLVPLDQSAPGADTYRDFTWKQILDVEACTMCGRCEEVCPASRAQKPLSPHKIVRSIFDQIGDYRLHKKRGISPAIPRLGEVIAPDEIWSCTTCGACNYECPSHLDIIEKIIDLRRNEIEQGNCPTLGAAALEGMVNRGNPWALPPTDRTAWVGQVSPSLIEKTETVEMLYWVGCAGAYDPLGQEISRAMVTVLNSTGVRYAVLGNEERCCGDPARRLGEEGLFQDICRKNIITFAEYGISTIVTNCPHCFNIFRNEYPLLGGEFRVLHHAQYLADLWVKQGRTDLQHTSTESIFYHDPCYLARYNADIPNARRFLQNNLAVDVLNSSAPEKTLCCGGGGGQMWIDVHEGDRIENVRIAQIEEATPDTVATACPYCKIMFDTALSSRAARGEKWTPRIKDVAELWAERL